MKEKLIYEDDIAAGGGNIIGIGGFPQLELIKRAQNSVIFFINHYKYFVK